MRNIINKGEVFHDRRGVISYGGSENSYGENLTVYRSGQKRTTLINQRGVKFYFPTSTVTSWIYFDYFREVK